MNRPNILFVFADQLRYDALGSSGNPIVRTPNLDRLAGEGVVFDRCFSSCPICSPYRGQLFSGKYPHANGVVDNEYRLRESEENLPRVLGRAGYRTGFVGKLHLGYGPYTEEKRLGFDWVAAYNCGHDYYDLSYHRNEKGPVDFDCWAPEGETDLAIRFIENHRRESPERPFALFLGWGPPHWPYDRYPEAYRVYDPGKVDLAPNVPREFADFARRELADYYGNISGLDAQMGRLLAALERLGLAGNTILCFSSDHGDHLWSHGYGKPGNRWLHCSKRASKATPYEESIHIPFLVRCPEAIPAGRRTDVLTSSVDAMPTLLSLCGLEIPEGVQGTDLAWAARGEQGSGPDSVFLQILGDGWPHRSREYHRLEGGGGPIGNRWVGFWRAVRDERWLYARWHAGQYGPWLFDRQTDPFEMNNLAPLPEFAAQVEKMEARLEEWLAEVGDPFETGERHPETGELLLGQEFTSDRWDRK